MIISHRHKFVFFRIPKTGSSTAAMMLRLSGAFNYEDIMAPILGLKSTVPQNILDWMDTRVREMLKELGRDKDLANMEQEVKLGVMSFTMHMTPKDALKVGLLTMDQLREYRCFGFLRHPLDRHISAYAHAAGIVITPDYYKQAVRDGRFAYKREGQLLIRPTTMYFFIDGEQVLEPLFFSDYDNELRRVIDLVGGIRFSEIPRLNPTLRPTRTDPREAFIDDEILSILEPVIGEDMAFYQSMGGL